MTLTSSFGMVDRFRQNENNKEARSMIEDATPTGQGELAGRFGAAHGAAVDRDAAAALPESDGDDVETGCGPSLELDANAYLPMLADYDLTEEQARAMLTALWSIMRGFVEMGISRDVCGELGLAVDPVLSNTVALIGSGDPTNPQ